MKRLVLHWTGGGPTPSKIDLKAYHALVDQQNVRHFGDLAPEANLNIKDGIYARHAGGFNTGAIGLGLCGMAGAKESPFNPGNFPIKMAQYEEGCLWAAEFCVSYKISVSDRTVVLHSEVRPRFGAGIYKWDVNWLPGMSKPGDPFEMGDSFRKLVQRNLDELNRPRGPVSRRPRWFNRLLG